MSSTSLLVGLVTNIKASCNAMHFAYADSAPRLSGDSMIITLHETLRRIEYTILLIPTSLLR